MHYTGKLYSDCSTFDSSVERERAGGPQRTHAYACVNFHSTRACLAGGDPFSFTLGKSEGARVIGIATAVGFAAAFVLRKVLTGV